MFNDPEPGVRALEEFRSYFMAFITERRLAPRDDLISDLNQSEVDGHRLDDDVIFASVKMLLPAGVEKRRGLSTYHDSHMSTSLLQRRASAHWLALQATLALTLASVRIGTVRRKHLVKILGELRPAALDGCDPATITHENESALRDARRVGRMVQRVARALPWRPTCLRQALATQWLLRRRGIRSVLHLGVADVVSMDAHAWVTVDGRRVVGRVARPFTPVASFEH